MVLQPKLGPEKPNYSVVGSQIEVVGHFTSLGSFISLDGCINHEFLDPEAKASTVLGRLSHVLKKSMIN